MRSNCIVCMRCGIKKLSQNATFQDSVYPGNWTHFPSIIECVLDQTNLINIFCFLPSTCEIARSDFDNWNEQRCGIQFEHWLEFNWIQSELSVIRQFVSRTFRKLCLIVLRVHFVKCVWEMKRDELRRRKKTQINKFANSKNSDRKNVRQNLASSICVSMWHMDECGGSVCTCIQIDFAYQHKISLHWDMNLCWISLPFSRSRSDLCLCQCDKQG